MDDHAAPGLRDLVAQRLNVQGYKGAQVEHGRRHAFLGQLVCRSEAQLDGSAPRHQRDVLSLAHHRRLSKRHGVGAVGNLCPTGPVKTVRLAEEHWVRVTYRLEEEAFGVVRIGRHDDLDSRALHELRLDGVGVDLGGRRIIKKKNPDRDRQV